MFSFLPWERTRFGSGSEEDGKMCVFDFQAITGRKMNINEQMERSELPEKRRDEILLLGNWRFGEPEDTEQLLLVGMMH